MTEPRVKPMIFSGAMVKALLSGTKSQTRLVLKPQPPEFYQSLIGPEHYAPARVDKNGELYPGDPIFGVFTDDGEWGTRVPFAPGDLLWVREAWADDAEAAWEPQKRGTYYRADPDAEDIANGNRSCGIPHDWRPSIHMPRWRSRLTLRVTEVRVERVQEIEADNCYAEGVSDTPMEGQSYISPFGGSSVVNNFGRLWDSINGQRPGCAWADNPWIAAISFSVIRENIDRIAPATGSDTG